MNHKNREVKREECILESKGKWNRVIYTFIEKMRAWKGGENENNERGRNENKERERAR